MSIEGIPPSLPQAGINPALGRRRAPDEPVAPNPRAAETPAAAAQVQTTRPQLQAAPPPGTDPALWSVLTSEERAFFAQAKAMGPLTYGPGARNDSGVPPVMQGGRIDVRI